MKDGFITTFHFHFHVYHYAGKPSQGMGYSGEEANPVYQSKRVAAPLEGSTYNNSDISIPKSQYD